MGKRIIIPGVIVLVLIVVLILNYFNIIPLSKNFPQFFGWLPHMTEETSRQAPRRVHPFANDFFVCPIWGDQCKEGYAVMNEDRSQIVGLGYFTLLPNTELISMMDGSYEVTRSTNNNVTITLTDTDGNIKAIYNFIDPNIATTKDPVVLLKGDIIYKFKNPPSPTLTVFGRPTTYALVVYIETQDGAAIPVSLNKETGQLKVL